MRHRDGGGALFEELAPGVAAGFTTRALVPDPLPPRDGVRALAQVRHRARPVAATVRRQEGRPGVAATPVRPGSPARWVVETDEPVWAAAPGQACVLYAGDVVLGGGRIARA